MFYGKNNKNNVDYYDELAEDKKKLKNQIRVELLQELKQAMINLEYSKLFTAWEPSDKEYKEGDDI